MWVITCTVPVALSWGCLILEKWLGFWVTRAAFIMHPTGGGTEDFRGVLKFLEQKKGGYENCLNNSWGMLIFCKILSSFCDSFKK